MHLSEQVAENDACLATYGVTPTQLLHDAGALGPLTTAVHPTHLERAGSIERIALAKSELPRALPAEGLAVLNADDPRVAAMREVTPARVRTFGVTTPADVTAADVVSHGVHGTEFTLRAPWGERRVRSGTPGRHLVPHALAAAAVGVPSSSASN